MKGGAVAAGYGGRVQAQGWLLLLLPRVPAGHHLALPSPCLACRSCYAVHAPAAAVLPLQNCGCYSFKLAESGVMGMHRWALRWTRYALHPGLLQLVHAVGSRRWGHLSSWARPARPVPVPLLCLQGCAEPGRRHGHRCRLCAPRRSNMPACPLRCPPIPPCRIVQNLDAVKAADVVICVTGMDGGLASVVAGLVEVPVIALPTSTGAALGMQRGVQRDCMA